MRYISNGTWFDKGTEVILVVDCSCPEIRMGLFEGQRNGDIDQEICPFDEFEELPDAEGVHPDFVQKPAAPLQAQPVEHCGTSSVRAV